MQGIYATLYLTVTEKSSSREIWTEIWVSRVSLANIQSQATETSGRACAKPHRWGVGEEWEECGCTRSKEGLGWPWLSGQGSQCKRNSKGAAWKGFRTLKIEDFIWLQWEGAGVVISRELTWSNFCTYEALYYYNTGKISLGWEISRECGEILYPIELYNKIKKKTIICYVGSKNGGPLGM